MINLCEPANQGVNAGKFCCPVNRELANPIFVLEMLPDGEFRFVRVNSAYARLTGLSKETIQGKMLAELLTGEIHQKLVAKLNRCVKEETSVSYEERGKFWGADSWWQTTLIPVEDEASNRTTIAGTIVNITERKQQESILEPTQTRFQTALRNSPIVVFQQDRQLRYTWIYNPHPGFDSEAVLGKTDSELLPAEDAVRLVKIKQQVLETGIATRDEVKTTINGIVNFYDLTVDPLYDGDGNIVGVTCATIEISQRKQAEIALNQTYQRLQEAYNQIEFQNQTLETQVEQRTAQLSVMNQQLRQEVVERSQAEELIQKIADTIPHLLYIYDPIEQRNVYANDRHREFFGCTPAEIQRQGTAFFLERMHPDDLGKMAEFQERLSTAEDGEILENEFRMKNARGEYRWLHSWDVLLSKTAAGVPEKIIGTAIDITDRKQVEEQLYRREQEFKALGENSPDIIARFDRQLRHVYVNPAVELAGGIPRSAFIGKTNQELGMSPELVTKWDGAIKQVFDTTEEQLIEFDMNTPNGVKTYQSHLVPEYAKDGAVEFVLAVVREITELKRVKEELQTSRDFLDTVLNTANEGITVSNRQQKYMVYNDRMQEIVGYSQAEAEHPDYFSWLYPNLHDLSSALAAREAAFRGENIHNQDWQITHKDGSKRTLLISTRRLIYDRQEWIVSTFRDITERTRVQEALRHSEQRYRTLVETIPYGIREIDLTGRITFSNQACLDMFGYQPEEMLGKPMWYLLAEPAEKQRLQAYLARSVLEQSLPGIYYAKDRRKDGSIINVEVAWNYRLDRFGQAIGFVSVLTDVTARKQAEAQLQASLHEKELLLKEVHHRVKNNLQVISSIFSLQSQYIQSPQVLSILEESQNRIASMALIHEKLYQSENLAQVDFADYIQTLTRNLFDSYNIKSDSIDLDLQVDRLNLNLDTAIACGLLINELVSNSLKHGFPHREAGQSGKIFRKITIVFSQVSEGELYLEVKDNGVGLPSDLDLAKINSLGLRLVRALTRQIRGQLTMKNQDGAVFQIAFPQPQNYRRF